MPLLAVKFTFQELTRCIREALPHLETAQEIRERHQDARAALRVYRLLQQAYDEVGDAEQAKRIGVFTCTLQGRVPRLLLTAWPGEAADEIENETQLEIEDVKAQLRSFEQALLGLAMAKVIAVMRCSKTR